MFDYREDMAQAIRDYLKDTNERDYETLYDEMWVDDSITNNSSCFNVDREQVLDNMDLLMEACEEFGIDHSTIGHKFMDGDYGYFDATIRCYLLGEVLNEVLAEEKEDE